MRTHVVQTSFLSGVLDPRARARVETDAYNQGMLVGVNVEPIHLGGVRRRRGLRMRKKLPNFLSLVESATATAPRGGTAVLANDNNATTFVVTTVNVSTVDPYVVSHLDCIVPETILFADALQISSSGGSSTQFRIQYSTDDVAWTDLGAPFAALDTTVRSYRRRGPVTARYWRVVKVGGTDMGTAKITLGDFNLYRERDIVSNVRQASFEVSTEERYTAVFTDHSALIFRDGVFVHDVWTPYTSADLAELDIATNVETMAIVHEDYAPAFLIRESTTNFQLFPVVFDNVPQVDFADALSPAPTSDVQTITFDAKWIEGDTFQFSMMGAKSAAITYAGDNATTAVNIAREVQKMWTVQAFTGVSCLRTGTRIFAITFAAASAAAYTLGTVSSVSVADATAGAATLHTATGVARREPLWSATRGYPRTVDFFEGRMYFGGTRSKQQTIIGSQVNNLLSLILGQGLDDEALQQTLNGRTLNAIQGLFGGRSLQLFTTGGEFRYVKEQGVPITPGDTPVNQTGYGSARIRPVSIDGATIYVQRNRKSIRDFRFEYTENAYNSLGVSSLAAHLIYDVRDLAAYNGSASDEINLVLVVNGVNPNTDSDAFPEGTVAVFNSRKESNVQAWTIWTTDGKFRAVSTILEDMFFSVQRELNGVDGLYFEQGDPTYYTDCAIQIANSPAASVVTGLGHLNGVECRVRADRYVLENVTPVAGSATLQQDSVDVEIGLNWTPEVTPMPLQTISPSGTNAFRKKRVTDVSVKVRNTLGLLCNGRPLPDRKFDVGHFDEPAMPFSGVHNLEETTNWDQTEEKLVRFTQVDPLPMEILGVDIELTSNE